MKSDKKQHEKDYLDNKAIDCPWCGHDKPDHSCGNCYSEMSQEDCWEWQGYCSEKCLKYITEELPRHRQEKINLGIKCQCDESQCAKCLSVNCKDKNCITHTKEAKIAWRKRWEITNHKPFPEENNF